MVDNENTQLATPTGSKSPAPEPRRGLLSRIFRLFSRRANDDFEKRLQNLSKEERTVHTRMKRRTRTWAKLARGLIVYSIIVELFLLALSIWTTRSPDLPWKTRGIRVLPTFVLPVFVTLVYSALASYYRMRERKDQSTLERLRAERQAKIDELKEKTNYYALQQLIQQYDSDPAAKQAAATILASKIGVEAGLKLAFQPSEEDNELDSSKSPRSSRGHGLESTEQSVLRRRRGRIDETEVTSDRPSAERLARRYGETAGYSESLGDDVLDDREMQRNRDRGTSGGWIARFAAMLVGEDPTQCYALICKNCHMHNGLAKKEDFPYITYHCPHCHALNGPSPSQEAVALLDGPSHPQDEASPAPPAPQRKSTSLQSGGATSQVVEDTATSFDSHPANVISDATAHRRAQKSLVQ